LEDQVSEAEAAYKRQVRKMAQMYHLTFSAGFGAAVLADMEESYGGSTYVRGDTHESAYKEGQRSVVLAIRELMEFALRGAETNETSVEGND
jgi:hypothetical protein